jgi:serine/threonine-protein kinase
LPLEQVLRYGLQLADAVAHAHHRGIVHRDLKSANVIITPEGRAKVLDFGLAKRLSGEELVEATTQTMDSLTGPGTVVGTLAYMAPEQLRGQAADARSDIWALGVMLYEMAAGQRPFQGRTGFELSSAILSQTPTPLPPSLGGPPLAQLGAVIERCLAKEPGQRYQRASEVHAALAAIQSGAAIPLGPAWKFALSRRRWLALSAVAAMIIAAFWALRSGEAPVKSIAILPFTNASGTPNMDYLSQGISESLITGLSRAPELKVVSRDSAFRYAGKDKHPRQIGRELGVDTVLKGRLLQRGESLSIAVELLKTRDGAILWSQQWERPSADLLQIEQDIARQVRVMLAVRQQPPTAAPTGSPEAFRLYLQGRYFWNTRTEGNLRKSAEFFQHAIDNDPNYPLAWAGLADSFLMLGGWSVLQPRDAYPRAKAAATRAIAMDQSLAEPHATLGYVKTLYEWDWPGADREFRRAIELQPDYSTAHHWYAFYHQTIGDFAASLTEIERAREIDPLSPVINAECSFFYAYARRYDRALLEARKIVEVEPASSYVRMRLAYAYALLRRRRETLDELEKILAGPDRGVVFLSSVAVVYGMVGERDKAQALLQQVLARSRERYVFPALIAWVYAVIGDTDRALEYFDRSIDDRSLVASWLRAPELDNLRSDPRYKALFARLGLKP